MRSLIAFLLLAFVAFVASQPVTDSFVISNLGEGATKSADYNETFTPGNLANGYIVVNVLAPYPVVVCFQDGNVVLGALEATCNAEGLILADTDSVFADENKYSQDGTGGAKKRLLRRAMDDSAYNTTTNLYLRSNVQYAVSASWADPTANQTADVTINVYYQPCPAGANGYGPNCSLAANELTNNQAVVQVKNGTGTLVKFTVNEASLYSSFVFNAQFSALSTEEHHLRKRDISGSPVQIYARRDGFPLVTDSNNLVFDPSSTNTTSSATNSTSLTFNGPEPGEWFLLLTTNGDVSYTVTVSVVFYSCPPGLFPSFVDGQLNSTVCISSVNIIPSGAFTNETVPANGTLFTYPASSAGITYFNYTTSWLLVGVVGASHGTDGAPGIYASTTSIPSADSYEIGSAQAAQVNFLNVHTITEDETLWIIAVQPLETSDNDGFQIFAGFGCANNCSSQGVCPPEESADGYCTCNSGYKDFYCSTQKLKTIYIVLIAIGGAIVLAIAIGVPVGCYLKNRKRARYERV